MLKYAHAEIISVLRNTRVARKISSFDYCPSDGNYLYVAVRACTADVPNANRDMLPSEELETAYQTFIGVPIYLNHDNKDIYKARGVVIDATYHETADDKWVEILMEIDCDRSPKLCELIKNGSLDTVSMGCSIESSTCSICGNVAYDEAGMCEHIKNKFTTDGAYEICNGIEFFEISWVIDPADVTAVVQDIEASTVFDGTMDIEDDDTDGVKCPVCDSKYYDGKVCPTCGYVAPPEEFSEIEIEGSYEFV